MVGAGGPIGAAPLPLGAAVVGAVAVLALVGTGAGPGAAVSTRLPVCEARTGVARRRGAGFFALVRRRPLLPAGPVSVFSGPVLTGGILPHAPAVRPVGATDIRVNSRSRAGHEWRLTCGGGVGCAGDRRLGAGLTPGPAG
ncbi:hypothetical protein GCM10023215_01790 [Pseudonocardia yuanmonensis]|uniref:Secreted protein n=1 Tax=Pseudonocardia yuanmonensis TaxID=1095914 RepID=A0ABP8VVN1_9PSEU